MKKIDVITFRVFPSEREFLIEEARAHHVSVSAYIRALVNQRREIVRKYKEENKNKEGQD